MIKLADSTNSRRAQTNRCRALARAEAIIAYGGQCTCCGLGFLPFLTLDHSNDDGSVDRMAWGSGIVFKLRKLGYPPGYRVMCWLCNCARQYNGGECPHMKLKELELPIKLVFPPESQPRTPGAHISNVIRDLENTITKPGQRRAVDDLSPEETRRMSAYAAMGFAWEDMIKQYLKRLYYQEETRFYETGELERDGLYGHPDWFDGKDWLVEEMKCTWRSSNRDIELDFWSWWVQIKAYCLMLGVNAARLRVFFVNGNYRDSGPQVKCWEASFTDLELRDNFDMLRNHAKAKNWIK